MTIDCLYTFLLKFSPGFALLLLSTIFFNAFRQKEILRGSALIYFLGLVCLVTYYVMWLFGKASLFYYHPDLHLLFNSIPPLGVFLVYKGVKNLFSAK